MTHTPPPTPDNNAVAAGNGFAIDGAGVPVLDVDERDQELSRRAARPGPARR